MHHGAIVKGMRRIIVETDEGTRHEYSVPRSVHVVPRRWLRHSAFSSRHEATSAEIREAVGVSSSTSRPIKNKNGDLVASNRNGKGLGRSQKRGRGGRRPWAASVMPERLSPRSDPDNKGTEQHGAVVKGMRRISSRRMTDRALRLQSDPRNTTKIPDTKKAPTM